MFVKEDKIILIIIIILILKQWNIMDIDIFINLIKIRLAIPPSTIRYSVSYRIVITSLILIKLIFFLYHWTVPSSTTTIFIIFNQTEGSYADTIQWENIFSTYFVLNCCHDLSAGENHQLQNICCAFQLFFNKTPWFSSFQQILQIL